jgi:hypothetical protein
MTPDGELRRLLRAVQHGDEVDALADNGTLASALGWPVAAVAACLQEAKERSFIWGMRSGQTPAPWFTDLELTVQGRRFLKDTP